MRGHEIGLLLAAIVSEILGTVGGFGSSTFFVPLAGFFEDLKVVFAVTALLHVFSNVAKLLFFGRFINWPLLLRFGPVALVLTGIGAWLTDRFPGPELSVMLGLLLVSLSSVLLLNRNLRVPSSTLAVVTASGISGFLTGLVGTGGAIRGLALSAFHIEKNAFVATSASIDIAPDILRAVIYFQKGYLDRGHYFYLPLLFAAAYLGTFLGKRLLDRFTDNAFRSLVLSLILVVGVVTIIKAIVELS